MTEFHRAVKLVIDTVSFDKNSTVQVFEANIRYFWFCCLGPVQQFMTKHLIVQKILFVIMIMTKTRPTWISPSTQTQIAVYDLWNESSTYRSTSASVCNTFLSLKNPREPHLISHPADGPKTSFWEGGL